MAEETAEELYDQRKSVLELANRFETGQGQRDASPLKSYDKEGPSGRQLLEQMRITCKELHGRVVGRNKDDVNLLQEGIEELYQQWEITENAIKKTQLEAQQAAKTFLLASKRCDDELAQLKKAAQEQALATAEVEKERQWLEKQKTLIAIPAPEADVTSESQTGLSEDKENFPVPEEGNEKDFLSPLRPSPVRSASSSDSLRSLGATSPKLVLTGRLLLGETLRVGGIGVESATCKAQWFQARDGEEMQPIAGAVRQQYSPEPADAGCILGCKVTLANRAAATPSPRQKIFIQSSGPIVPSPGLKEYVESMVAAGGGTFSVVIVQINGEPQHKRATCMLEVGPSRVQLHLEDRAIKEKYSAGMQVCGARGGGDAAAQGIFLALKPQKVFMMACDTPRERNAAIMLIRQMAAKQGLTLGGP